ncbi:hypothetical protein BKA70DRAFT_534298 [Coprinopsis sp. MPI-PUGE-AT-0042]|nr:hypothetical protein BKA70DRAFT_534298 [Coprinopsis sp. MPI-PUGE-AT-0042]
MSAPHTSGSLSPVLTRQGTIVTYSNNAMEPFGKNNSVTAALGVLDALSDVGKVVPFIAPAFVLLKIIIDIERSAEEVDAKCNDLLDRISFMLGHLPVLRDIEIMPATRQVVDRVIEALKEAATLISSYRKQSALARRLSLTNRERFTLCADHVNTCCSDLLMSLQIHQSKQLDVLTRAVPLDDEDVAAATFVEEHGGDFEAIQYDKELVKEFAEQRHLTMDDAVMEELGSDVPESISDLQGRIETLLQENVSKAIADGFQSLASRLVVPEIEQQFVCVQCDHSFTRSTNAPKACSFHRAEYDSWSKCYPCCGTKNPCEYSSHREKHHCDYSYGNFFPRVWAIRNYTDTKDEWASLEDVDLEDADKVQRTSIGELLRWQSRASRIDEPTILISVGRVWYQGKYFWDTFTVQQLDNISKSVRHSKRTLIYRTSPSEEEYAMAEWLLSISGKITGVRLTAKAATSTTPFVRVVPIDLSTGKKSGDVIEISNGGLRSYTPASPYILPETVRVCPEVSDSQVRPPRTDFKTKSTPTLRVILKGSGDPPLKANPNFASEKHDFYHGSVSVFNNNAPGSNMPVTVAGAKAMYRMVGEKEYKPVKSFKLNYSQLPVTIDPRQSLTLEFEAVVPKTEEDVKTDFRVWNRAFGARHRPLRLKFIMEDIEGEECSVVMEYVFTPFSFEKPKDTDLGFFYIDDPNRISRRYIRAEPPSNSDNVLRIDGNDVKVKTLQQTVFKALKTGSTEIDMEIGGEKVHGEWEWKAWALVDISCRRVYAFKILLQEGKLVEEGKKRFACLGYVACPTYGDVMEKTRPIAYATEKEKLPPLQPYTLPSYPQDDKLDDFKPVVPPKPILRVDSRDLANGASPHSANGASEAGAGTLRVPEDLNRRLASLDNNLARIAVALEQLVGVLQAR